MAERYDVIIVGSGPGGGTMAWRLAQTGKRILLLERGDYLPRERDNWDAQAVFIDAKYQAKETWYGADGRTFHPGLHYFVGGNSKVYGAVLLRLRERDFEEIRHPDGIIAGMADPIRGFRALLSGGRGALSSSRIARRGSYRAAECQTL